MNVPFLDLPAQAKALEDEILPRMREVIAKAQFAGGPAVDAFEGAFAQYCEADFAVGVNSGTSALHLALRALDIGPGDEVITIPMTFVATTWAISYVGATPIFVDVDPERRTMDPALVEAAITERTKAILPVHLYGQPCDLAPLLEIANKHGIPLVEDAAQAHGARYQGKRVGARGAIGCFSFYPGKNLGAWGEGGAITTNDEGIAERIKVLRNHAQKVRYEHCELGHNYRMDGLQGVVLEAKLKHLDEWNAARRAHAAAYCERLQGIDGLFLPPVFEDSESVVHLFAIEHEGRDALAASLADAGVATGQHYPIPVHLQPAYAALGHKAGEFPVSERIGKRCLSLPMFPELTEQQIDYVCEQVKKALS